MTTPSPEPGAWERLVRSVTFRNAVKVILVLGLMYAMVLFFILSTGIVWQVLD